MRKLALLLLLALISIGSLAFGAEADAEAATAFQEQVQPLLQKYCLKCHSTEKQKGDLDLEAFRSIEEVRHKPKVWQTVADQLADHEMPPKEKPQPSAEEYGQLTSWTRKLLLSLAREHAGDPGPIVLRRLSNAEYTYTVRDLTGVESLEPLKEFPADGAAGEGFSNVGQALAMSPPLLAKYFDAARDLASHAIFLPDGMRFSAGATRRDWTAELEGKIRAFYRQYAEASEGQPINVQGVVFQSNSGGRLPVEKYLAALLPARDALRGGMASFAQIAAASRLSPKYLALLFQALEADSPSPVLEPLRIAWRAAAGSADLEPMFAQIHERQQALWKFNSVGDIGITDGPKSWLEAVPLPDVPEAAAAEFRALFPAALCYEKLIPADTVVTMNLLYREDEPFIRLMLDEAQHAELDRLWDELHFVYQDALQQVGSYAQLLEYMTQGGNPKLYEPMREPIQARAEAFRRRATASEPAQLDAVLAFAGRAYRHPLTPAEAADLRGLHARLLAEKMEPEEALRLTLARVFLAPAFLYRGETPGPGSEPAPLNDLELATRLSYFLTSSVPDEPLRVVAESGRLHEPATLSAEAHRLLGDARARRLAIEFACQWLHVRDFASLNEKSETQFPTFTALRGEMLEETVQFFTDLFTHDGSVLDLLGADYVFVNEALARHYGIPGVTGETWRRVDGARQYGRGGILTQATMLAKQAGASRTSPILRGNWITETLLGERIPRPPKDVPPFPETGPETLTVHELTVRHTADARCAGCHARMDPYGFALENYDGIGRRRDQEEGGGPIDARGRLADGKELEGVDSLRAYLLDHQRPAFRRQFCRKLLGFALGRSVLLTDEPLLAEMQTRLAAHGDRFSEAIEAIIHSRQFLEIRGRAQSTEED